MAKKSVESLAPMIDLCTNLLKRSLEDDKCDDFSIRFTWDEKFKLYNVTATNHGEVSNG